MENGILIGTKMKKQRQMNKKAQFYIISAIIIVIAISSVATVTTYTITKSKPEVIYDLSEDLLNEASRVIDSGMYDDSKSVEEVMSTFIKEDFKEYSLSKADDAQLAFIYGDLDNVEVVVLSKEKSGSVTLDGTDTSTETEDLQVNTLTYTVNDDTIKIELMEREFEFKLKKKQNFYFVIVQEKNGEWYIKKSK